MNHYIICHYGEIALKGRNRKSFEQALARNIRLSISKVVRASVRRISGRIIIGLKKDLSAEQKDTINDKLKNTFGIVHFSPAISCQQDIKEIGNKVVEELKKKNFSTFRINTQRAEKTFPLSSQQINEQIGAFVLKKLKTVKVNLKNPDITVFIEIVEKYAFIYTEKIPGSGGLPVGVSGKAVSLLSGGIDSPVASYLAMKRGLEIILIHFHAFPYTNKASLEKVKKIAAVLNRFQSRLKLYLIPFAKCQKDIMLKTPAGLRIILYRRMMLRIAEKIAEREKAKAIVTGENLGQVASQTIENMTSISQAVNTFILRPLVGEDKFEIIKKAEKIGTYQLSILPYDDCCSLFLPKRPKTKSKIEEIEKAEKNLDLEKLITEALEKASLETFPR